MIRINEIRQELDSTPEDLFKKCASILKIKKEQITDVVIARKSIDSRKKEDIFFSYSVDVSVLGDEEKIRRAAAEAQKLSSIHLTYYRDAYSENVWYLEIFHESASKKHAVQFLREYTGAVRVIVFGDNLNDLPMFEEADLSVAVENAAPQVKEAADFITDDVVSFIENYIKTEI